MTVYKIRNIKTGRFFTKRTTMQMTQRIVNEHGVKDYKRDSNGDIIHTKVSKWDEEGILFTDKRKAQMAFKWLTTRTSNSPFGDLPYPEFEANELEFVEFKMI